MVERERERMREREWERRDLVTFGTIHFEIEVKSEENDKYKIKKNKDNKINKTYNEIQMGMRQNHHKVSGSVFELLGLG